MSRKKLKNHDFRVIQDIIDLESEFSNFILRNKNFPIFFFFFLQIYINNNLKTYLESKLVQKSELEFIFSMLRISVRENRFKI